METENSPHTRISRIKAENRKSHAAFPPSTGGSENSGSVSRISLRSWSVAWSPTSDSRIAVSRGGVVSIGSACEAVAMA